MWFFWLFVAMPIDENALFILVGGLIGLWPTLALVVITGLSGVLVIRAQGVMAIDKLQRNVTEMRDPAAFMAHGALIMLAGLLLIFPGFFTDTVGLLLLLPPIRRLIMRWLAARADIAHVSMRAGHARDPFRPPFADGVIDGDYVDEDELRARSRAGDNPPPPDTPLPPPSGRKSGWTRH